LQYFNRVCRFLNDYVKNTGNQGCRVVTSYRFLGGVVFITTLGVGVRFFCPTPDVHLDNFIHHTTVLGIPVEMVQFLLKFSLLKQIYCCAPQFPLILTAKFHSFNVKELESEISERSDILPPTP